MITYKAIIQYFDVMCERHQQINSFTYGELGLFDLEKFTKYPALHLTPTGTAIDDQTITYGFDVVIFDRYNTSTNKMVNEATCLSDALLILQDICKELTDGKYFINEDTNISMDMPIVATPFIDTQPDNCSGWTTSFEVITPNEASACTIPYSSKEQQFHNKIVFPSFVPSQCMWYTMFNQTQDFLNQDQGQIFVWKPFYNNISTETSTWLRREGGSIIYNYKSNALHFKNDSPSSSQVAHLYKDIGTLTNNNITFFVKIKDFGRYAKTSGSTSSTNPNQIIAFGTGDHQIVVQTTENGKITIKVKSIPAGTSTNFAVLPTNGTDAETQHKRIQPITLGIQFSNNNIKLFYSNDLNDVVTLNSTFILSDERIYVGNTEPISGTIKNQVDINVQEFLYTLETMTDQEIINTMNWLNYR